MATNTPISEEIKQQVIYLYRSGKSLQKVSNELNIHKSSVHRIVKNVGIARTVSEGSKLRPKPTVESNLKRSKTKMKE